MPINSLGFHKIAPTEHVQSVGAGRKEEITYMKLYLGNNDSKILCSKNILPNLTCDI